MSTPLTPKQDHDAWTHRLARALVFATLVLLVAGGQVTSTASGDAVPTWPFPLTLPMVGGVLWELGHRQVAGAVAALTALVAVFVWSGVLRGRTLSPRTKKLAIAAVGLVLFQAALGGVRVLQGAADIDAGATDRTAFVRMMAIFHACIAQAFLLVVVGLAASLARRREPGEMPLEQQEEIHSAARLTVIVVFAQILLGSIVRHTNLGVTAHIGGMVVVVLAAGALVSKILAQPSTGPGLWRPALGLSVALMVQIGLGFASWMLVDGDAPRAAGFTAAAVIPSLHLVLGGIILAISHLLALRSRPLALAPEPVLCANALETAEAVTS